MKFFTLSGVATANCGGGGPGYQLTVIRTDTSAAPPATYGNYTVIFNRCTGAITYATCGGASSPASPCDADF